MPTLGLTSGRRFKGSRLDRDGMPLRMDESLSSAARFEEIAVREGLTCEPRTRGVALLRGVGGQVFHDGYILQQVLRQVVPLL